MRRTSLLVSIDVLVGLAFVVALDANWGTQTAVFVAWCIASVALGWGTGRDAGAAWAWALVPLALGAFSVAFGDQAQPSDSMTWELMLLPAAASMMLAFGAALARYVYSKLLDGPSQAAPPPG
jgi:hypothetical protein